MSHLSGSTQIDLKKSWGLTLDDCTYPGGNALEHGPFMKDLPCTSGAFHSYVQFKGWLGIQNWLAHIKPRKRVEVNQEVNN